MAYCDKTDIEDYLLITIDSSFDTQIAAWIASITAHINQLTGRNFEADTVASGRLYSSDGRHVRLLIDDCTEIETVETGDTYGDAFTATTDFLALPLNETPKNAIVLKYQPWPRGTHRITAKWGYSVECPDDIKFAATVMTAGIVNAQVNTGPAKKLEWIGGYKVQYNDDRGINDWDRVMAILDARKKIIL